MTIAVCPPPPNPPEPGEQGLEVDLLWRTAGLAVEMDGWDFHRFRAQFENDHEKTVELQNAGYVVLRFTWRQTRQRPEWVVGTVRRQLALLDGREEAA